MLTERSAYIYIQGYQQEVVALLLEASVTNITLQHPVALCGSGV
jgi:hypothetical protein